MPLATGVTAGFGLFIIAIFTFMLDRSIRAGDLDLNNSFGLRTKTTKRSQKAWVEGHKAAEPLLRLTAVLSTAAAVLPILLAVLLGNKSGFTEAAVGLTAGLGYIVVISLVLVATAKANKAAKMVI